VAPAVDGTATCKDPVNIIDPVTIAEPVYGNVVSGAHDALVANEALTAFKT
jgi:hypothetical protein